MLNSNPLPAGGFYGRKLGLFFTATTFRMKILRPGKRYYLKTRQGSMNPVIFRFLKSISPTLFLLVFATAKGQMITGVWHGKINRQKVEVKIIQNGDSLTGTSYYYESANNYRRYSIKGYFDQRTNTTVWWDDQLIEEKSGRFSISSPGKIPLLSQADFNCPGGGKMMLDGSASQRETVSKPLGDVHLDKSGRPVFEDEWDFIIENYTAGANDPDMIDSVAAIAFTPAPTETVTEPVVPKPAPQKAKPEPVVAVTPVKKPEKKTETIPEPVQATPPPPLTIREKFVVREKKFIKEIPVSGDSIELKFYDNAEIDGDSISLFLDGRLIFEHIRLSASAYIIKLPVNEIKDSSELVMVAENLGLIPPNTSYMVALINGEKYDAYLASTEGTSALIRLRKLKFP